MQLPSLESSPFLWKFPQMSAHVGLSYCTEKGTSVSPVPRCVTRSRKTRREGVKVGVTDKAGAPNPTTILNDVFASIRDYSLVVFPFKQENRMIRILFQNHCSDDWAD